VSALAESSYAVDSSSVGSTAQPEADSVTAAPTRVDTARALERIEEFMRET
jgi:hypothetical protein